MGVGKGKQCKVDRPSSSAPRRKTQGDSVRFRITGHESFPFRYSWLPKIARLVKSNAKVLADDEAAMVELGLGKNMVRSARFWAQVTGVIQIDHRLPQLTPVGTAIFDHQGMDPYLEDIRTLWLLHWNLATNSSSPLLAWDYLLSRYQDPEIVPSTLTILLEKEAARLNPDVSPVTIEQHRDVFLHTYVPTRGKKGQVVEDNLDCPLIELELLQNRGERVAGDSSGVVREQVYAFRHDENPAISPELFAYCVAEFWKLRHASERTLSFRELAHGQGSPGRILRLPEDSVRNRLEQITQTSLGCFNYSDSASIPQLQRGENEINQSRFLKQVYSREHVNV